MIVTYIRSSSYGNYDYCQMQYFLTYVLGHYSPSGKRAQMGTIVHKAMEVIAVCAKELQDNPGQKTLKITDDKIGEVEFTGRQLKTKKFVNSILKRSWDAYTSKCKHKYYPSDFRDCTKWTETALEYNDKQFDPRTRKIIDAEPTFDLPIEEDWAHYEYVIDGKRVKGQLAIKGTIDLVMDAGDGIIEVLDYKTGQRKNWATGEKKDYNKLMEDPQLLLYNYAISRIYPDYDQAIMSIFYLRDGGPFSLCFDKDDQDRFLEMLKNRFHEIQRNENPRPISKSRKDFRCEKICHFYKTKWPGTDRSMCHHVEDQLVNIGYTETAKQCKRKGFDIGYYEAPG